MKRAKTFSLGVFLTLSLTFLLGPTSVVAQTGLLIRTPAELGGFTYEFFLNEGGTACDKFTVQHDFQEKDTARTFYTMVTDLEIDPETGNSVFPEKRLILDHQFSLASWITTDKTEVTLEKWGDNQEVEFCVTVPEGAAPGTHFANIFMSNLKIEEFLAGAEGFENLTGAAIGSRTGVNVLVTVGGLIDPNIDITALRVTDIDGNPGPLGIFEYLPIRVVADLSNTGNQFIKPTGNLSIHTGDLANPVEFLRFNPNGNRILPGIKASVITEWDNAPLYIYKHESSAENEGGNILVSENRLAVDLTKLAEFRFGRYFATLQMFYTDNNGQRQLAPEYSVEFWIIPWKIILAVIGFVVLAVLIYRQLNKNNAKYISKQSKKWKKTATK